MYPCTPGARVGPVSDIRAVPRCHGRAGLDQGQAPANGPPPKSYLNQPRVRNRVVKIIEKVIFTTGIMMDKVDL